MLPGLSPTAQARAPLFHPVLPSRAGKLGPVLGAVPGGGLPVTPAPVGLFKERVWVRAEEGTRPPPARRRQAGGKGSLTRDSCF